MFWPAELGQPSSTGGQNDFRYAYFPQPRRLAVERAGQLSLYDTLDHQIGGVSQQQSGSSSSFTFSSQYGTFTVDSLPRVDANAPSQAPMAPPPPPPAPAPFYAPPPPPPPPPSAAPATFTSSGSGSNSDEIFTALGKLGELRDRGILTDDEFATKKRELLARL
jgi:hypothetical protein